MGRTRDPYCGPGPIPLARITGGFGYILPVPDHARITILGDEPIGLVRPELFGHFIEHLGRCIDEGIWVGEDSAIDNAGGFRSDVLEALRQLRIPVLRWP